MNSAPDDNDPSTKSLKSYHSSNRSEDLRKPKVTSPVVVKLTQEDIQSPKEIDRKLDDKFEGHEEPEIASPPMPSDIDLNLPNVILLVSDYVKLIRNNSVPMLQVQVEIIQSGLDQDNDMCMLGLNDVIYIVPEFTPREYDVVYARSCTGNEQEEFKTFFEHYQNFTYSQDERDDANIPARMSGLNKNCMTAIERDHYEPDLRGKAFINIKNLPNGHYTIFYLRIG